MARKSLSWLGPGPTFFILTAITFIYVIQLRGADEEPGKRSATNVAAKYLGATSCSSSGCHGGAGQNQNQYLIWSLRDFHSRRPFATLTTARSKQIADALQIKDPTSDPSCTTCHAPLHNVPHDRRGAGFDLTEAVSCESCHGPSEHWLRSHTRPDYTHALRVATGMRDLKSLYGRANMCVACHQNVSRPLLTAGHPTLIFELDGQCVSQPKHWREKTNWHGAQAWLVGQAAALREMSWQLATSLDFARDAKLGDRAAALHWLLQKVQSNDENFTSLPRLPLGDSRESHADYRAVQLAADDLARYASEMTWSAQLTSSILRTLAKSRSDFRDAVPKTQQALRAERLVLALDRLLPKPSSPAAEARLNDLFKRIQSLPDFDPVRFGELLDEFALTLQK